MKKIDLIIIIVITTLIISLCGCSESNNDKLNAVGENDVEINEDKIADVGEGFEISGHVVGLIVENAGENGYKEELIKQINHWKTLNEEDEYYSSNVEHNVSEIKEFYFPTVEIDGYELSCVEVTKHSFSYYYLPIEEAEKELLIIGISRPEARYNTTDPLEVFKVWIEQAEQQEWGYLTEDNIIYSETHGDISTQIYDTLLTIKVPDELNNYEYLRDLAFRVIETAELVKVE